MRTTLIAIGNSQGIRLPKPIIEQCGFDREVEMTVEGNSLVLRPVKRRKTLTDLLAAYDRQVHAPGDRPWDDGPVGKEAI